MIPTEDLEECQAFLMQACDELPSPIMLTIGEQEVSLCIRLALTAVTKELLSRESEDKENTRGS